MSRLLYEDKIINMFEQYGAEDDFVSVLKSVPTAQIDSCDGCKWEDAFGYGECHHCKRCFNDMYEVDE